MNVPYSTHSDNRVLSAEVPTLREAAIAYAEIGLAVLPLQFRGKRPVIDSGFHGATSNVAQVRTWWDRFPEANIGAVPGSIGCVVVDVDGDEGERLAKSLGVLDVDTAWTVTKKGQHVWLRLPQGMVVGNVSRAQLDVRAHSGYVVMSPSVHPSGPRYGMAGSLSAIAPAPAKLVEWLNEAKRRNEPSLVAHTAIPVSKADVRRIAGYLRRLPSLRDGQGRNNTAYRLATVALHDCRLSEADAMIALDVWNARNLEPLSAAELRKVIENALRYGTRAAS